MAAVGKQGKKRVRKRAGTFRSRYLGVIFIAAVLVPAVLLAAISLRAAGREEEFTELQLSRTLLAEDALIAAKVNAEAERISAELGAGLDVSTAGNPGSVLAKWKSGNPLVGVPFLVGSTGRILWPQASGGNRDNSLFLQENNEFLSGRAATPVYRNIALAFTDTILAESERLQEIGKETKSTAAAAAETAVEKPAASTAASGAVIASADSEKTPGNLRADSAGLTYDTGNAAKDFFTAAPAPAQSAVRKSEAAPAAAGESAVQPVEDAAKKVAEETAAPQTKTANDLLSKQKAVEIFNTSDTIRSRIYQEAQQKGDVTNPRVVQPVAQAANEAAQEEQSQYISEEKTLSQIVSSAESGIIPRFVGEKLAFLFWERQKDGGIAGCEISADALKPRVAGVIPEAYSSTRIIAILDETGKPLAVPESAENLDWRKPFVAREIGEGFPRWEVASYLTSPEQITANARASSLTVLIMVFILCVSVAGGGTLVLTSLNAEMRLARNKSTFVTNVSHELKTPLTSISLFVELLRQGRRTDPIKVKQYLSLISGETERLTRLINNVLDFSSMERGRKRFNPCVLDLVPLCRDLMEGQKLRLESQGFHVEFAACAQKVPALADGEAVKQCLLNLVSNAEKYSPQAKAMEVAIEREEGFAVIHVRDRGSGVPEQLREKIFQEFFRVDDSLTSRVKGTGLGLTIARRIARDLGGDLTCAARAGGGSDFALRLPMEETV